MECPCRYCTPDTGRDGDCHGRCQKYKEWKVLHDKQAAERRQHRESGWSRRTGHWYQTRGGNWRNRNLVRR